MYHTELRQFLTGHTEVDNCNTAIMPFIDLETNLPANKFSEDFLRKLCTTTASALGKPEDVSIAMLYKSLLCIILPSVLNVSLRVKTVTWVI